MRVQKNQFFFGLGLTRAGTAVPESEKLVTISNYFGVSVDYLLKDEEEDKGKDTDSIVEEKPKMIAGIIICIAGIVSMVIWGLLSIFSPEASDQIGESSMIFCMKIIMHVLRNILKGNWVCSRVKSEK